jgi:Domain of unknown function (DUF4388)
MSQGVIQGSMREAPLPDIIQLVSQGGKSGCFYVEQDSSKARIYLKEGRIIHAVTQSGEGLDELMGVAFWAEGTYRFEEGVPDVPTTITKSNASILMELGRCTDEWRVISQKIPSLEFYPASTLLPGEIPQGISPREKGILSMATGYYSVPELAEAMQRPIMALAKDLYGLVVVGLLALKAVRSGSPVPVEAPQPDPAGEPVLASAPPGMPLAADAGPLVQESREDETAKVRSHVPTAHPQGHGSVEAEEPLPVTVASGVAGEAFPVEPPKPAPPMGDPQRTAKLMNFTQRIVHASKLVLPEYHHDMVNRLHAQATQQISAGVGPDAVKGLALAISRGAVDAGCDAEMVRTLNSHLKALFTAR